MAETDRSESYLEIQVDRSTIVLAAAGFLACLAVAYMLGVWTGGRRHAHDASTEAATLAEGELAAHGPVAPTSSAAAEEDVDSQPLFGDRSVSARTAPATSAVPEPLPEPSTASPPPATGATGGIGASGPRRSAAVSPPPETRAPPARTRALNATRTPPPPPTAPARATQPSREAAAPTEGAGYVIQVAALKSDADAAALKKRLQSKGYPVRVVTEGAYHKVQVGPFARRSEAEVTERRLKREESLGTWLKPA